MDIRGSRGLRLFKGVVEGFCRDRRGLSKCSYGLTFWVLGAGLQLFFRKELQRSFPLGRLRPQDLGPVLRLIPWIIDVFESWVAAVVDTRTKSTKQSCLIITLHTKS